MIKQWLGTFIKSLGRGRQSAPKDEGKDQPYKVNYISTKDEEGNQLPLNYMLRDCSPAAVQADVDYVIKIAQSYLRWNGNNPQDFSGKVVLEIGPGYNLGSAIILACWGAKVLVADKYLTSYDVNYHSQAYALLNAWMKENMPGVDRSPLENIIQKGSHYPILGCYPAALEDLGNIKSNSVDIVFSNAVLEHLEDTLSACSSLARITAPGGLGFHQIDFRDHKDFTKPLEFLLLEDADFDRLFAKEHGGTGNRLRPSETTTLFEQVGFEIVRYEPNLFVEEDYMETFLPRLRTANGVKYQQASLGDLREGSALYSLRKKETQ